VEVVEMKISDEPDIRHIFLPEGFGCGHWEAYVSSVPRLIAASRLLT
jgi:hypothetical protein